MIQIFDQEIPNKMSELTIEQFEKISQILNNQDFDNIEKYVEMFKYLGIKEEMWDDYPFSEFIKLVQEFNLDSYTPNEAQTTIELEGHPALLNHASCVSAVTLRCLVFAISAAIWAFSVSFRHCLLPFSVNH